MTGPSRVVAERLAEAAAVIRHLPPVRVPGYFNTRPPMVMEFADRVGQQAEPMRLGPANVTVAAALGAALIEAGYATPESDGPEQAVAPPPEAATAGPQRRRPR